MDDNKCRGQHGLCDICDGLRSDPHTGWGGFRDHVAKRDFNTDEEQKEYYRKKALRTDEEDEEENA